MINPDLHLHFDTLTPDKLPRQAVRDGFGQGLVEVAEQDERVVAHLDVDSSVLQ